MRVSCPAPAPVPRQQRPSTKNRRRNRYRRRRDSWITHAVRHHRQLRCNQHVRIGQRRRRQCLRHVYDRNHHSQHRDNLRRDGQCRHRRPNAGTVTLASAGNIRPPRSPQMGPPGTGPIKPVATQAHYRDVQRRTHYVGGPRRRAVGRRRRRRSRRQRRGDRVSRTVPRRPATSPPAR